MAVTVIQLEGVKTQSPFIQRLEDALVTIAENISTEPGGTALHAQRKALASAILNNPSQFLPNFADGVIAQLSLVSTNMVGSTDVDTTDAALQATISSIFNDYFV